MIEPVIDRKPALKYDGKIGISVGRSRFDTSWKNRTLKWSALVKKLQEPTRTPETRDEYDSMKKTEQDRVKDVGGFVGGTLIGGRRGRDSVESRYLITLDVDFAGQDFADVMGALYDFGCCIYSTHKHRPEKPRLRLLIPLDRPVSPEEYEAVARKLAEDIGIEMFDDTTYQPSRLMYWPSCAADGVYLFRVFDRPFLKADDVLARYDDWTDVSAWPVSSRDKTQRKKLTDKQKDPREKPGAIGAFCRTYDIHEAIAKFLPDVYARCEDPTRYTYLAGSTAAGMIVYEDARFAYSNHSTDPAGGQLCNSFDLVRIHKFGHEDAEADPATETTKLTSYKSMLELVNGDEATKHTRVKEKKEEADEDFKEEVFDSDSWETKLDYNSKNGIKTTLKNLELILRGDEKLKDIAFNELSDSMEIMGSVPWHEGKRFWRDADDAQLELYLAKSYAEFPKTKILTAITKVVDDRSYHPVRQYLTSLPEWDGVERVDSLLIDYLGAEDSGYTRAVTRKTLCGAIARVVKPGCKFDTMLVLCGKTGIGKSTIVAKLAGEWFTDNLSLSETKDKTAAEKIQGHWIVEIGELAGMRKADIETLKGFISRQDDKYRAAYGRRVESHKRQCIFIGTTNAEDGYLRDITGNRRFWPVNVSGGEKNAWSMTKEEIDQIWSEVKRYYEAGESLVLDKKLSEIAEKKQMEAMEHDDREGIVRDYLEMQLPVNWSELSVYERHDYFESDSEKEANPGIFDRTQVCCMEIWCEALGYKKTAYEPRRSYEIGAILQAIGGWEKQPGLVRVGIYGPQRVYKKRNNPL